MLRRWLSKDSVERAGDEARVEVIDMLTTQLAAANARADMFAKERNDAYREVADLREKVARLETRMEHMQARLEMINANPNSGMGAVAARRWRKLCHWAGGGLVPRRRRDFRDVRNAPGGAATPDGHQSRAHCHY
ncbi:hypothetical protein G6F40_015600 [Rhizopus arrhizus]|nr:hypothetical protein G6F31_019615 [Rhizopus arrhizus]KAG1081174.1 hypothetical protein G6F40_015600 [Rhizopus arrhizus]